MSTHATPQHRAYTWQDPRPTAEAIGRMSGLEVLHGIGRGTLPTPPAMDTLAIEPAEIEPGRTVFELTPAGWHYNALGTVHGGVLATLADNALGAAVHTRLPAGSGYTTQGLTITFLRPVTVDTGRIRCEATAVHVGRRSAYATATVTDLIGRLLAHATTTCLIFRADGRQPARTREQATQGTSPTA
ncbi:PaaI family thioesterase [Streptomyces griseorubiginosus]|uniref:PaaI family thioesterase n=1 Tax=Streptomyces griseorubiginosus TaxID=67304 RepID=UPI002E7FDB52|nr:PaaI family thioesterase [Streptomyces griseorubiginosus]WUB47250.1 PaaI family thioesterase [Streptomyces griseorubiginosus]WUB55774.1 PaaI family thioesterase [Streptomyces griseorubiginosus]